MTAFQLMAPAFDVAAPVAGQRAFNSKTFASQSCNASTRYFTNEGQPRAEAGLQPYVAAPGSTGSALRSEAPENIKRKLLRFMEINASFDCAGHLRIGEIAK